MAHVLIIEDEPAIAMILSEVLRDHGHESVIASTGAAGLERLAQDPVPDLVLLDLFMPGLGGRAVLEHMRAGPGSRNIPVVVVTGAVPSVADFPPVGSYQALLGKPFNLSDVIAVVDRCLAGRAKTAKGRAGGEG
jgi:CheY-like chemotaxis protein